MGTTGVWGPCEVETMETTAMGVSGPYVDLLEIMGMTGTTRG